MFRACLTRCRSVYSLTILHHNIILQYISSLKCSQAQSTFSCRISETDMNMAAHQISRFKVLGFFTFTLSFLATSSPATLVIESSVF